MYHHYEHCITNKEPTPSSSGDMFTLFPLLPPELRIKVWEAAAQDPHPIELSCTPTSAELPRGRWFSHSKPPVLFSICSESRAVALASYSVLSFSPRQIGIPPENLYINFSVGTLWLCADLSAAWAMDLLQKNEQLKGNLKSLVIKEKLWADLNPTEFTPPGMPAVLSKWHRMKCVVEDLRALEDVRFHS
jgi:hypothetical protein